MTEVREKGVGRGTSPHSAHEHVLSTLDLHITVFTATRLRTVPNIFVTSPRKRGLRPSVVSQNWI